LERQALLNFSTRINGPWKKRENWELLYADIEDVPTNNNQLSDSKMELKRQQLFIENQRSEALRAKQKTQQQYQQSSEYLNNQSNINGYNNMNFNQFVSMR